MIKKATELNFNDKKFTFIIAGVPGIGKTTLALSSPKPLLVDLDNGVSRVSPKHRTDTMVVSSYKELREELGKADLSAYETIVIDTGGKLLEWLKPVVISEDAKNGMKDGNLSLKGYGAIKRKFADFSSFLRSLNKHIVYVFHATEVKLQDDATGLRIRMEGSSKDDIWDDVDIGGFMEIIGKKRTIGFSNCDRYYAKGTYGVHGIYELPELEGTTPNTTLIDLINQIRAELNKDSQDLIEYKKVMGFKATIESAKDVNELNNAYKQVKTLNHILTSKEELKFALKQKALSLGVSYDKEADAYR